MIRLTQPRYFVPVHGEYRQLEEHRRLAAETGIPLDRSILLEDGDVLEIDDAGARTGERVIAGRVLVDGTGEGDIDLEERAAILEYDGGLDREEAEAKACRG